MFSFCSTHYKEKELDFLAQQRIFKFLWPIAIIHKDN